MKKKLFLILKKHWFDEILAGRKSIEYRTFNEYWFNRLAGKNFTDVIFQCGYNKNAPRFTIPLLHIEIGIDPDTLADCFLLYLDTKKIKRLNF